MKCGKPKYITDLSGDLRSTNPEELFNRLLEIDDELTKREDILKKADYRIGVKTRDSERLARRIEKTMATMDKAVDDINKESDKIFKDITALDEKISKVDFEDKSLKDKINSSLKNFKETHNTLFDMDLTGENLKKYQEQVSKYEKAGTDLNKILQEAYNLKIINKSDLNKSDISKNINRINKGIDKFIKNGDKVTKDIASMEDNQMDIDYITSASNAVIKEMDVLLDEFERTNNHYMDVTPVPRKIPNPNPQMILVTGAKPGDSFTLLPRNYDKYLT